DRRRRVDDLDRHPIIRGDSFWRIGIFGEIPINLALLCDLQRLASLRDRHQDWSGSRSSITFASIINGSACGFPSCSRRRKIISSSSTSESSEVVVSSKTSLGTKLATITQNLSGFSILKMRSASLPPFSHSSQHVVEKGIREPDFRARFSASARIALYEWLAHQSKTPGRSPMAFSAAARSRPIRDR